MKTLFLLAISAAVVYAIVRSAKERRRTKDAWAAVARERGLELRSGGAFARPSMSGIHDGYRVMISVVMRGGGKSRSSYTRYRVHYQELGAAMRLTREMPILSALGRFFGGEDHETGDAAFDDKVVVRAPRPQQTLAYLTRERR